MKQDEMKLPLSTKKPTRQLLEQLETQLSRFWEATTLGNPKNAILAKKSQIALFGGLRTSNFEGFFNDFS